MTDGFAEVSYTTTESGGGLEVCVEAISPSLLFINSIDKDAGIIIISIVKLYYSVYN